MALYIPHSIFHLAQLLYVRPETFGPYYACPKNLKKQTMFIKYGPFPCSCSDRLALMTDIFGRS